MNLSLSIQCSYVVPAVPAVPSEISHTENEPNINGARPIGKPNLLQYAKTSVAKLSFKTTCVGRSHDSSKLGYPQPSGAEHVEHVREQLEGIHMLDGVQLLSESQKWTTTPYSHS